MLYTTCGRIDARGLISNSTGEGQHVDGHQNHVTIMQVVTASETPCCVEVIKRACERGIGALPVVS